MLSWLLRLLLYPSPKIRFRDDEIAQYEQWASMMQENRLIADDTPYPKHRFLQYLSLKKSMCFTVPTTVISCRRSLSLTEEEWRFVMFIDGKEKGRVDVEIIELKRQS